ncbi:hypothetical protein H8356DRAFT_1434474 [Neocallimastix lanati (nom. inval.)]|nr:hypothetical protein H8356DRAFT_1434474 [Neocallimastix sp. JGI-2020a]
MENGDLNPVKVKMPNYNNIKKKIVELKHIESSENLADILTKSHNNNNKYNESKYKNDKPMNHKNDNKNYNKNNQKEKFCLICEKHGHTLKECCNEYNNGFNYHELHDNLEKPNDDTKSINLINKINNPSITNENLMLKHKNTRVLNQLNTIKYLLNTNNYNKDQWLYDSGAGEHITNNKSILQNFKNEKINLSCANGTNCTFDGYGETILNINNYKIKLNRVLYSKDVTKNMISGKILQESSLFLI